MKKVLTIAGSDCSGGAGIQADLKTMTVHGVYGMSVITALTAQNTMGVSDVLVTETAFLKKQLDAIFTDIVPDAIKIGMLPDQATIHGIVESFSKYENILTKENIPIVLDPVMVSTSGRMLMEESARESLQKELFPWVTLLTPNIPEAEVLTGRTIENYADMEQAAEQLEQQYQMAILIKGGHCKEGASDLLCANSNKIWFSGEIMDNPNKHGTGCTLSSAIASNLALGYSLEESCKKAKNYLEGAILANLDLGQGCGPLNHMYNRKEEVQ